MTGRGGDDVPVELLKRYDGEPDDQYMARLVSAHLRVHSAWIEGLEGRVSALVSDYRDLSERVDRGEQRQDRSIGDMLGMEGRILAAIRADKAAEHATCKALSTMAADVVRAWGQSWGLLGLSALIVIVFAAWLLDLVPRVETNVGTVTFTPQAPPALEQPRPPQ